VDSTTYWPDGTVKTDTGALGAVTSTTNDFVNKQIVTVAAYGTSLAETTTDFMNADWAVTSVKDALNHTATFTLNSLNEATATTDPLGRGTSATLDANGNVTSATDGLNHTTTFTLDAFGETVKTTDPTGNFTTATINANGATTATAGGPSGGGQTTLDAVGNEVQSIDADGNVVRNQFDAAGRLIGSTDALGNRTQWQYDKAGNKIGEIQPNGATLSWQYDAAGRLVSSTDQLGRTETYAYDADNRLLTETWKSATGAVVNTENFTYNAAGEVLTEGDNNGTITNAYDVLGRQTSQTDVWGLVLTMGYDAANNLVSETDGLGGSTANTYDAANELTDMKFSDTSNHALSINYTYNAADEVTLATRYADATESTSAGTTAYGYDAAGRTTSILHDTAAGGIIDGFNYAYNAAGQVSLQNSALGPNATDSYDAAGQLLSDGTKTNSFDAEGNRTNAGDVTTTGNELTTDGTWNYSYDATGDETLKVNISIGAVWSYGYDNANRLVSAQHKPSSTGAVDIQVNYTYDILGNRIAESVSINGGAPTVTKFAYDQNGNAGADLNAGGTLITRRVFGNGVDALLARIDTNGVAWYLTDNLGSVRDIANSSGALIDHRDYDSYGNIIAETYPSSGDRYGWTGREFDVETDLQYNRARYYDPATGRWMSQDPMEFDAGDSNLYRYANNQPTGMTDPSGMQEASSARQKEMRWEQKSLGAKVIDVTFSKETLWALTFGAFGETDLYGGNGAGIQKRFANDQALNAELAFPITRGATLAGGAYDLLHQGAGNLTDARKGNPVRGFDLNQTADTMRLSGLLGPLGRYAPKSIATVLGTAGVIRGGNEMIDGNFEQGALDLSAGAFALRLGTRGPSRTAIEALADTFRGLSNSLRPAAVARLVLRSGNPISGRSTSGSPIHEVITEFYANRPAHPNRLQCAEIDAISQALRAQETATGNRVTTLAQARAALQGSRMQTARVRLATGNPDRVAQHGTSIAPCENGCDLLLQELGIAFE
jgi:RHS repeat-associated protein